jgi:hypothetical protein
MAAQYKPKEPCGSSSYLVKMYSAKLNDKLEDGQLGQNMHTMKRRDLHIGRKSIHSATGNCNIVL